MPTTRALCFQHSWPSCLSPPSGRQQGDASLEAEACSLAWIHAEMCSICEPKGSRKLMMAATTMSSALHHPLPPLHEMSSQPRPPNQSTKPVRNPRCREAYCCQVATCCQHNLWGRRLPLGQRGLPFSTDDRPKRLVLLIGGGEGGLACMQANSSRHVTRFDSKAQCTSWRARGGREAPLGPGPVASSAPAIDGRRHGQRLGRFARVGARDGHPLLPLLLRRRPLVVRRWLWPRPLPRLAPLHSTARQCPNIDTRPA
jgi:hypothetical protein